MSIIGQINPETSWEIKRLGKITSSCISDLITKDGKETVASKKYLLSRVAELLTSQIRSLDNIFALQWGKDKEPEAIELLKEKFSEIEYYGGEDPRFFQLTILSGGSPDAIERSMKIVFEVKCPENPANHVSNLMIKNSDDLKKEWKEYWWQLQMNMLCVSKELGVSFDSMIGKFVSYSPLFDKELQLHIIDIEPNIEAAAMIYKAIENGEKYINECLELITPTE